MAQFFSVLNGTGSECAAFLRGPKGGGKLWKLFFENGELERHFWRQDDNEIWRAVWRVLDPYCGDCGHRSGVGEKPV